ncbi:hypothetical protein KP509_02G099100 [Ceratopteris richardii]|nr:hypothetical protein KP509_02G099100 [Ceratopteris richardii]
MDTIKWTVSNYVSQEDAVILLYVQPTDGLYGADWGDLVKSVDITSKQQQNVQDVFSMLSSSNLVRPLLDAKIPYIVHAVRDCDRKERICLEAERLRLNALVMGIGCSGARRGTCPDEVSEYCMSHCECPVVIVHRDSVTDAAGKMQNKVATLHLDSRI